MRVFGFNIPTSVQQWAKGAAWAFVGAATGVLAAGGGFQWHAAVGAGALAFFAYLHSSEPKA